jgi:hypothetical protein
MQEHLRETPASKSLLDVMISPIHFGWEEVQDTYRASGWDKNLRSPPPQPIPSTQLPVLVWTISTTGLGLIPFFQLPDVMVLFLSASTTGDGTVAFNFKDTHSLESKIVFGVMGVRRGSYSISFLPIPVNSS